MNNFLPSPYLRVWWCYRCINPRDKVDQLLLIFIGISISYKVVDILKGLK